MTTSTPYLRNIFDEKTGNQRMYYSGKNKPNRKNGPNILKHFEQEVQKLGKTKREKTLSEIEFVQLLIDAYESHENTIAELKGKLEKHSSKKSPFHELFKTLPPNYPVQEVLLNGVLVPVTRFLNINEQGDIAHFSEEDTIKSLSMDKIDGVYWGRDGIEC